MKRYIYFLAPLPFTDMAGPVDCLQISSTGTHNCFPLIGDTFNSSRAVWQLRAN
jgi:hypothetical protein